MDFNNYFSSQFLPPMLFPGQETFPTMEPETTPFNRHQNPRKKRTKFIRTDHSLGPSSSGITKPKSSKKPDPSAPKITGPCTECGKKFWSWKALFGHMRCHPERQWRGINPPPNFRRLETTGSTDREASGVTEEDHEVATCLLMLANGASNATASESPSVTNVNNGILEYVNDQNVDGEVGTVTDGPLGSNFRFECSSCKKVFGSHQALGGHRASHKNVKGCFAINKSVINEEEETEADCNNVESHVDHLMDVSGHKCSICSRVFSTGQALGGHKRCHWEKASDEAALAGKEGNCGLDLDLNLNLKMPGSAPKQVLLQEDDITSSASFYNNNNSSGLELDLRLGL